MKKFLAAIAAASLAAAPAMASNPAAKLSVASSARASADQGDSHLLGGGVFVAVIAAVAVILGIIIVANEDDSPNSP